MDKKLEWIIKSMCNVTMKKRENGGVFFTPQEATIVDNTLDEKEIQELFMKVNLAINEFISDLGDVEDFTPELKKQLVDFVLQKVS